LLISHNLIQEGVIQSKSGLPFLKATLFRLIASITTVMVASWFLGHETATSALADTPAMIQEPFYDRRSRAVSIPGPGNFLDVRAEARCCNHCRTPFHNLQAVNVPSTFFQIFVMELTQNYHHIICHLFPSEISFNAFTHQRKSGI
jgi:hypothetical protein